MATLRSLLLPLLVGTMQLIAAPADFNALPDVGTAYTSATNPFNTVRIESPVLHSETLLPSDETELQFHFTLKNTDSGYVQKPQVALTDSSTHPWALTLVSRGLIAGDLAPGLSTAVTTVPLKLRCATTNSSAVKTAILSGQHIMISATELYRFISLPRAIDQVTRDSCTDLQMDAMTQELSFTFSTATPLLNMLGPGSLLYEDPLVYELLHSDVWKTCFFPITSSSIFRVSHVTQAAGTVIVYGNVIPIVDAITDSFAEADQLDAYNNPVRDPLRPPVGTSFHTQAERQWMNYLTNGREDALPPAGPPLVLAKHDSNYGLRAETQGLFTINYPFNEISLTNGISMDGEFLLRALQMKMAFIKREGQSKKLMIRVTNHAEVTLRLTADAGAALDNVLGEREENLFTLSLPTITIPIGTYPLTITPVLQAKVGCNLQAPTRIQVPFTSSVESGYTMYYDVTQPPGQRTQFEPYVNIEPLAISDPTIGQQLTVSAEAWIQTTLDLLINGSVGPGIGFRATGRFSVSPLSTPWWQVSADYQLRGRFVFNALGFPEEIVDAPLHTPVPIFERSSTKPAVPNSGDPRQHAAGNETRWARALQFANAATSALVPVPRLNSSVCRVAGTAEDVYVVTNYGLYHYITRIGEDGEAAWHRRIQHTTSLLGECSGDGGILLASASGQSLRLFKYNGSGTLMWQRSFNAPRNDAAAVAYTPVTLLRHLVGATEEFYLILKASASTPDTSYTAILRLDASGQALSFHRFDTLDKVNLYGATMTPEGDIVVCGSIALTENPPYSRYFGSANVTLSAVNSCAYLAKLRTNGTQVWSNAYQTFFGTEFHSVTATPDGRLYTAGKRHQLYNGQQGSQQVTEHLPDGTVSKWVSVSQPLSETLTSAEEAGANNSRFELPHGSTPFDEGSSILWTPHGVILGGSLGLDTDRAGVITCLTENLAVRWFVCQEVSGSDIITDGVCTDQGYFFAGISDQMLPNHLRTPVTLSSRSNVLLKLPREGKIDFNPFRPGTNGYLEPGVHDAMTFWEESNLHSSSYARTAVKSTTPTTEPLPTAASLLPTSSFTSTSPSSWIPLEDGRVNEPMSFTQWASFHQLPADPSQDSDFDGRSNGEEYFFGGNPLQAEMGLERQSYSIHPLANGQFQLQFQQSNVSGTQQPTLRSSVDLMNWQTHNLPMLELTSQTLDLKYYRMTLPTNPLFNRGFYQLLPP